MLNTVTLICFIKTSPDRINPRLLGSVILGKAVNRVRQILETIPMLFKAYNLEVELPASFRAFWFGEGVWIEDVDAEIGAERRDFILVAVDGSLASHLNIGALTANLIAEPVFSETIAKARTTMD